MNPVVSAITYVPLTLVWVLFYVLQIACGLVCIAAVCNIFVGGFTASAWVAIVVAAIASAGLLFLCGTLLERVGFVPPFFEAPFVLEQALWVK